MRITAKQVEGIFKTFIDQIGGRVATSNGDVGAYNLDYSNFYGYRIEKIINTDGGVTGAFGETRRQRAEMWYTLHFALRVIEAVRAGSND